MLPGAEDLSLDLDTVARTLKALHPSYECPTRELAHQYWWKRIQYLKKILGIEELPLQNKLNDYNPLRGWIRVKLFKINNTDLSLTEGTLFCIQGPYGCAQWLSFPQDEIPFLCPKILFKFY